MNVSDSSPQAVLLLAAYHGSELVARQLLRVGEAFQGGAIATGNRDRTFAVSILYSPDFTKVPLRLLGTTSLTSPRPFPVGRLFRIRLSFPRPRIVALDVEAATKQASFREFAMTLQARGHGSEGLIGTFRFFRRYYPFCAGTEQQDAETLHHVHHLSRFLRDAAEAIRLGDWWSLQLHILSVQTVIFVCQDSEQQAPLAFLDAPDARERRIRELLNQLSSWHASSEDNHVNEYPYPGLPPAIFFHREDFPASYRTDRSEARYFHARFRTSDSTNHASLSSVYRTGLYREQHALVDGGGDEANIPAILADLDIRHTLKPAPAERNTRVTIVVWVFLRSREQDFRAIQQDRNETARAFSHIASANRITLKGSLQLDGEELRLERSECTLHWDGGVVAATLSVSIPAECRAGLFTGRIHLHRILGRGELSEQYLGYRELVIEVREPEQRFFVSYCRADGPVVEPIVEILRSLRPEVRVFFDKQGIKPGEDWRERVKYEIWHSDRFCLMWSEQAERSENVKVEREEAQLVARSKYEKIGQFYHVIPLPASKMAGIIPEYPNANVTPLKCWNTRAISACLKRQSRIVHWASTMRRVALFIFYIR